MKRLLLLCGVVLALTCGAMAQNPRYDAPFPSISSTTSTPFLVANIPPNSPVLAVCNHPANAVPCTNYAGTTTFSGTACPNGAQDVPQPAGTSACQSTGDSQGNIGFFAPAGTYDYTVCIAGTFSCFGPYTVTLGGSGGGGGGSITVNGGSVLPSPTNFQNGNNAVFSALGSNVTVAACLPGIGVYCVTAFSGATADVQIAACLAAAPNGGICDARGFGASSQTIAACPLVLGGTGSSVGLLINTATTFNITCSNPGGYAFEVYPGSYIRGDGTATYGFGNAEANFQATTATLAGIISNWPRVPTGNASAMSLQNFALRSNVGSTITEGLISLSGIFSSSTVQNVNTVYCGGGGAALYITAPTTGAYFLTSDVTFVNDDFDCGGATASGHAIEIKDGGSAAGVGSINFYGSQAQHSALSEVDLNGNGSGQCGSIFFMGFHTENASFGTVPANVTINDCHNIVFDNWNTSGATPTAGNIMTVAQATANATHDIYIRSSRFVAGTNVVSSSVAGLASLGFTAQADSFMSLEYYAGLPLAQNICTETAPCPGGGANPPLENCTPDETGNSFYSVNALTNYFQAGWQFTFNTTTYINCTVYIPTAQTGATVAVDVWSSDSTAGHTSTITYADGVINSGTVNIGSLTSAASQTFTTTSTANNRVTLTFNVQSTLSNGSILVVKIGTAPTGTAPTSNLNIYAHFVL
jgi:hypothetical protein